MIRNYPPPPVKFMLAAAAAATCVPYDNMLSRFHLIPERHGQTDRQTDLLYQYPICFPPLKIYCCYFVCAPYARSVSDS